MRDGIYRKSPLALLRSVAGTIFLTAAMAVMIVSGLRQTELSNKSEGLRILEESIRRAVVIAYAVEGRYPESIAYLENNYGIQIDKTRYVVHYDIVASNLYPDVRVIELV